MPTHQENNQWTNSKHESCEIRNPNSELRIPSFFIISLLISPMPPIITKVAGPLVKAKGMSTAKRFEVAANRKNIGIIIALSGIIPFNGYCITGYIYPSFTGSAPTTGIGLGNYGGDGILQLELFDSVLSIGY